MVTTHQASKQATPEQTTTIHATKASHKISQSAMIQQQTDLFPRHFFACLPYREDWRRSTVYMKLLLDFSSPPTKPAVLFLEQLMHMWLLAKAFVSSGSCQKCHLAHSISAFFTHTVTHQQLRESPLRPCIIHSWLWFLGRSPTSWILSTRGWAKKERIGFPPKGDIIPDLNCLSIVESERRSRQQTTATKK